MIGSEKSPQTRKEFNRLDLECAITDAQGDATLLWMAIEHIGEGDAWSAVNCAPVKGFSLYMLTEEQDRALRHAVDRVHRSIAEVAAEFFGRKADE